MSLQKLAKHLSGQHDQSKHRGTKGKSQLTILSGFPHSETHTKVSELLDKAKQEWDIVKEDIKGIRYEGIQQMSWRAEEGELIMGDHLSKFTPDIVDRVIRSWGKDQGLVEGGLDTTIDHEVAHVIHTGIRKRAQAKGGTLNDDYFDEIDVLRSKLPMPSDYGKRRGRSEWVPEQYALEKKGGPQLLTKLFRKHSAIVKE